MEKEASPQLVKRNVGVETNEFNHSTEKQASFNLKKRTYYLNLKENRNEK